METTAAGLLLCTKCGKHPRADQEGTNPWCLECRAKYQREYNATKEGRAEAKGFARGVDAMRKLVSSNFFRLGSGNFEGREIAHIVANCESPKFEVELTD